MNTDHARGKDLAGMKLLSNAAVVMEETADSKNRGTTCSSSSSSLAAVVMNYPCFNFFPLTYDAMFQPAITDHTSFVKFLIAAEHPPAAAARELFKKELTPSDVGKLNRLVIPKKYAVRYFPDMQCAFSSSSSSTYNNDGMMLEFHDREGKLWIFRYCYWRSSQSFVFTKGWNKFVNTKKLCSGDTVAFYKSDEKQSENMCFVIDTHYTSQEEWVQAIWHVH
ncbi:hypothetical protein ZOSMA_74G00450 [Zostera marina]|uniref:TF-B3 domain-containing protein n=1 Tax=Zostera marina TaxID=29655 RepID=A0A0K9NPL0_ZOSMR|nr:hypothetical protein ZOSMA_74G00450 [Zostera marina]